MLVGLPPGRSDEAVSAVLALADPITLGPAAEEGVVTVAPAELDPAAERERLGELLGHAEAERARAEGKLGNAGFVRRAPSELVAAEREKAVRYAAEAEALRARLAELERG
jgi:valyl-tRNA synthetase